MNKEIKYEVEIFDEFAEILNTSKIEEFTESYLVNEDGVLLVGSNNELEYIDIEK